MKTKANKRIPFDTNYVNDQFLNQILALFSNVQKPDREARLLGYQVSPLWNVHK